jgi:hypothetical protein
MVHAENGDLIHEVYLPFNNWTIGCPPPPFTLLNSHSLSLTFI